MFKLKLLPEDFFNLCIKRKVEIKKLDKLPKLDHNYLLFIAKYQEVEIIPDTIYPVGFVIQRFRAPIR